MGTDSTSSRWRDKAAWLTYGHLAFAVVALIGWEHLDLIWPRALLPEGLSIGGEQRMSGLLMVGDRGQPARLASSADLMADWHHWVTYDERTDSSQCLTIAEKTRRQLVEGGTPSVGSAGTIQYWVDIKASRRLGPAQCEQQGGLAVARGLDAIEAIEPVRCSRDVFVAHGFVCPGERRSRARNSETFQDGSDYYPYAALLADAEGRTEVRVERDRTGSPINCTVLQSSGHTALDRQTCKLVGTDPAFTNVPTGFGATDLSRPITQKVRWQLPEEAAR